MALDFRVTLLEDLVDSFGNSMSVLRSKSAILLIKIAQSVQTCVKLKLFDFAFGSFQNRSDVKADEGIVVVGV